jgi:hypothetical protein
MCKKEELTRQHGSTHVVRVVRSYRDVGVLRSRKSQPVVYSGVCGRVRAWFGLRVFTRRLAIRIGGGCLVNRGRAAMADWSGAVPMSKCEQAFLLQLTRSQ